MSFPGQQAKDPWKMEQAVENAGFVQDVVIATTRLLHHETALTERDRSALATCRDLLVAASTEGESSSISFDEQQLEPSKSPPMVRAARTALPGTSISFEDALGVLAALLDGNYELDDRQLEIVGGLRDTFLAIGEANLNSMAAARHSRRDVGLWKPLTPSSLS